MGISCIQETHNERTGAREKGHYVIPPGRNDVGMEEDNGNLSSGKRGGVAIAVKRPLLPSVPGIKKINGRAMERRVKMGNA